MRSRLAIRAALCVALAVAAATGGCCKKKPPSPVPAPPPLCLELIGHPRLQWYQGSAHSLYVRLFPLAMEDAFVSDTKAAKTESLLADPPPQLPGSTGSPRSQVVYPSKTTRVELDAAGRDATAIGIVAGYFDAKKDTKLVVRTATTPPGTCIAILFGEAGIEGITNQNSGGGK